ncbi:MAG: hypothetical protein M3301_04655, partial [Chloroflexota bacterium]|nr:hypothetical protein [Chloroflexota bacterium]
MISKPTGVVAGDVLVAQVVNRGTGAITPPSGWTSVRDSVQSTTHMTTFSRVAGAAEPLNYTFTSGNAYGKVGGISAWSGIDTTNPIDVSSGASGTGTSVTAPSVTTTKPSAPVLFLAGHVGAVTYTPPVGMTDRWDLNNAAGTYKATAEGADYVQATAGVTGAKTATASSAGGGWMAQLVALRPAPPPAPLWNGDWDVGGIPHGTVCPATGADGPDDQYDRVEEDGNVNPATCGTVSLDTTRTRTGAGRSLHVVMKGSSETGTIATQREQPSSNYLWSVDDQGTTDLWFGSSLWLGKGWIKEYMTTTRWVTLHSWRSSAPNGSLNTEIHPAADGVPHFWLRRNTSYTWPDGLGTDMMDLG